MLSGESKEKWKIRKDVDESVSDVLPLRSDHRVSVDGEFGKES